MLGRARRAEGQPHRERRPQARRALDGDGTSVRLDDPADKVGDPAFVFNEEDAHGVLRAARLLRTV